jgi:hypothetical protein
MWWWWVSSLAELSTFQVNMVNMDEMGGACSTNGEKGNAFGWKARKKETTGKTKT